MARPRKHTIAEVAEALKNQRGFVSLAAKELGCSYVTVYNYMNEYPELKALHESLNEVAADIAENTLYKLATGEKDENGKYKQEPNVTALIFMLKTKYRHRGYSERLELTGANGGAIALKWENVMKGTEDGSSEPDEPSNPFA